MEFSYGGLKTNMASKSNKIKQKNLLSPKDYKSMSKDDLRQELRKRGIKISGKKSDLVKRLEKFDRQKMAESIEVSVKSRKSYENLTSNGGLENSCTLQHDATNALSSQTKQWIARKKERKSLVIWKRPIITFQYFLKELLIVSYEFGTKVLMYYQLVGLFLLLTGIGIAFYCVEGPHQKYVELIETKFLWCAYWVGLGVLSSVGLGTGLHTFVLYLGPHIAAVTLAAYECNSVNFPQPPYPDEIICPEEESNTVITVLKIMSKVRLEAFMWGAGTALGELPPYFMAKAARLSGEDHEDEELKEFEELLQEKKNNPEEQSFIDKAKLAVEKIVERVGFLGILACASIPNPVFDLAGITCGHFLVPFWTFFGATLIGKAVIKMHIQKLFVIIAFNENQVHKIVNYTKYIPYVGNFLHAPLQEFLAKQKAKLHRKVGVPVSSESSWLSVLFEKLVLVMVAYFVLSIVNSMAQSHHKRLQKRNRAGSKVAID